MLLWTYSIPLWIVMYFMVLAIAIWSLLNFLFETKYNKFLKYWRAFNICFAVFSVYIIFDSTILRRTNPVRNLILTPFYSIVVTKSQPEMWRSLLMNIALFLPFGISLATALKQLLSNKAIGITVFVSGALLSAVIEALQYFLCLGETWTDDVICNALGAFCGATVIFISDLCLKNKKSM